MGDNGGPRILVVEDDERVTSFLKEALEGERFFVESFSRAEDALAHIRTGAAYHVALVDVLLSGMDGLAFTRTVCSLLPDMFVVVMTGYGTGDLAAQAIRMGAYDYLPKPFDKARVLKVIQQAFTAVPERHFDGLRAARCGRTARRKPRDARHIQGDWKTGRKLEQRRYPR